MRRPRVAKLSVLGIAALAAACAGAPALAQTPDASPVKIGMVLSKQGSFGDIGQEAARGAMMAVDDLAGKVLGRPINVLWYDDPDPQTAQQNMSKLIDSDKVVAILGGTNSASSLAESAVAKRGKTPTIIVIASAKEITGRLCNRYTFRTYYAADVASRALVPALAAKGKKWYFLMQNYAAGQDAYTSMKGALTKIGGEEVGYDKLPIGTADFSSYILKIRQAAPDVVALGLAGSDLSPFLKQYAQYGMKDKIPVGSPFMSETAIWSLDKSSVTGTYTALWEADDPANPPSERKFAEQYKQKFGGQATTVAWEGWHSMHAILSAIDSGKSTDAGSIVRQMETTKAHDRSIATYYRAWDHQFIHPLLILDAHAPKKDKYDMLSITRSVPDKDADVDAVFGTQAEVGCQMGDL
ncbi:MAG: ABC transporter substrate-binding protein [Janthinobacterium lividum]